MITTTAQDLIKGAFRLVGAYGAGEPLPNADAVDALAELNSLIDRWSLHRLTFYEVRRSEYPLTASTVSYTIGDGATFDQPRPIWLDHAAYLNPGTTPEQEIALAIYTDQAWQGEVQKGLGSTLPTAIYYARTTPYGTIYPWPVPDQNLTLVLYWPVAVSQFADLTTSTILPPGYEFAMRYNLALLLADTWGRPMPPFVREQAIDSLGDLKRANYRMVDLGFDPALTASTSGQVYDIETDES